MATEISNCFRWPGLLWKGVLSIVCGKWMKYALCLLAVAAAGNVAVSHEQGDSLIAEPKHPIYPLANVDTANLKSTVAWLLDLSVEELIGEVPAHSGIYFVGCPHCHGGAQDNGVLGWEPGMGDHVRCNYCTMQFPNGEFPNNRERLLTAPSGRQQRYRYHEDADGKQYFFEAHAWYERRSALIRAAEQLAKLWFVTHDNTYGDRAAAIIGRFAQVYPDYAVKYDYPQVPVKFFPGDQKWPYEGIGPYRGAKWSWWGYMDIPGTLVLAYDLLQAGYDWQRMDAVIGQQSDRRIENDLFKLSYQFTTANPETYTNMSPRMYEDMIRLGRILGEPAMVHDAVGRFRAFLTKGFFDDGWWKEGAPSYHDMTINGLTRVANALSGYTDPPNWEGDRFESLDMEREMPLYKKALEVSRQAVLPNGRKIPINDTWWHSRGKATDTAVSRLWPSLGNAVLGAGAGPHQVMVNINWSGDYGHSHDDNGSIILYASGQELLSDIGYTHTRYRGWATHTASHNTVVIDQRGQDARGAVSEQVTGELLFFDDSHPRVKVVDVDASPAYASVATTYRRQLLLVHAAPGYDYVVDRFDVEGGQQHDWFLHGMCEEEGTLEVSIPLHNPVESLVPEWGGDNMPASQYDMDRAGTRFHAYAHLRDILGGTTQGAWAATWRYSEGNAAGLRTHIVAPNQTQVFRFRSPSVRRAREDENELDNFFRNGLMQRHVGGKSTFIAVHEPFHAETWVDSVQKENNTLVVQYSLNGTMVQDRIILDEGSVQVLSSAGWDYQSE